MSLGLHARGSNNACTLHFQTGSRSGLRPAPHFHSFMRSTKVRQWAKSKHNPTSNIFDVTVTKLDTSPLHVLYFSWAEFWFTSWSEKTSRLNPAERLTDLFPWRLCLVAGAAAAYLHTCRLCFSSQSRPWVQQGWGVPQHTWFQWPIPWLKTRSADLPQLRRKTGKRHRAQRTIKHPSVSQPPQALLKQLYLQPKT